MKTIKIQLLGILILLASLTSSCESFTDINKSVATVYDVEPVSMLYQVQNNAQSSGSTWNDSYAARLRWMQYCANIWGYSTTNFTYFSINIGSSLYHEYLNMGSYSRHLEYTIKTNFPGDLPRYTLLIEAARIMHISKGIATTDTHGSLVYTEGWGMRSGKPDLIEPRFETQEELFKVWDSELKEAVAKLKTATAQISIKGYDMAYDGDALKWEKAANALRLRIALRILKRDPSWAKQIANEVLAGEIPQSNGDGLILRFDKLYTSQDDWHSIIDMDRASAPFMSYLTKYEDPRKRLYFQANNLTPARIATFNSEQSDESKKIPLDYTLWEGGTVSYDQRASDQRYQNKRLDDGTDMRAMNKPQTRLWKGMQDNGSGGSWFPILTYADFCFMASEFVLEGAVSTSTAQDWYEKGVAASIDQWSEIGDFCKINDYKEVTAQERDEFLAKEGIAWNAAIAKEQIYCQSWVEHFKNNNEAWSLWKRTGYPNQQSSIVTFDKVMINAVEQDVPRRTRFAYPVQGVSNYSNIVKRLDDMAKDPEFGAVVNEFGRLWWDKE
ncbi:hypothetical protein AwDysgo_16670 [Bacteroidales bacterium]|nr:hypothetical protein AwDysgo_16670 [Bacteroidales bacterium]